MEKTTKNKYQLATFLYRAGARVCDYILISCLSFAFSLLFLINSSFSLNDFFQKWTGSETIAGWRILVLMICLYVLNFIYFVLIPAFWKGQTLFKKVFKIRFVSADFRKNFFWQIFRREILLWMLLACFNIVVGIIAVSVKNPMQLFAAVFNFSIQKNSNNQQLLYVYLATFIRTLYALGGIVPAFMVIYMLAFKKKRALQDIIGDGYVVFAKQHNAKKWNKFLFKKQINEVQEAKKAKIFEPFIDFDKSKYRERQAQVQFLKVHLSQDDLPKEQANSINAPENQPKSWYEGI